MIPAIEILLVEDSKSDAHLTMEALNDSQIANQIHWVKNGIEALDFLHKRGKYSNIPRPDLILLDINLPKKNGRELLQDIKQNQEFKTIPIVILTMSANDEDILRSYPSHTNCYLVKPINLDQFVEVIASIEQFWLKAVSFSSNLDSTT